MLADSKMSQSRDDPDRAIHPPEFLRFLRFLSSVPSVFQVLTLVLAGGHQYHAARGFDRWRGIEEVAGQKDRQARSVSALADAAADANDATVFLHDAEADPQAEAGTLGFLGGEERFKDPAEVLRG